MAILRSNTKEEAQMKAQGLADQAQEMDIVPQAVG